MSNPNTIAVIGGTGKSGTYLVRELLYRNYKVKLLVRNPEKAPPSHPNLELIYGDVAAQKSIQDLISGSDALISNLGIGVPESHRTIFRETTQRIIEALKDRPSARYIVLSGLNVDTDSDQKGPSTQAATKFMYTHFPVSTKNKQQEYELLVRSDLNWTLVRSSMIALNDETKAFEVSTLDCGGNQISARSLAQFMVDQLESEEFSKKAPFIWDV